MDGGFTYEVHPSMVVHAAVAVAVAADTPASRCVGAMMDEICSSLRGLRGPVLKEIERAKEQVLRGGGGGGDGGDGGGGGGGGGQGGNGGSGGTSGGNNGYDPLDGYNTPPINSNNTIDNNNNIDGNSTNGGVVDLTGGVPGNIGGAIDDDIPAWVLADMGVMKEADKAKESEDMKLKREPVERMVILTVLVVRLLHRLPEECGEWLRTPGNMPDWAWLVPLCDVEFGSGGAGGGGGGGGGGGDCNVGRALLGSEDQVERFREAVTAIASATGLGPN